MSSTEKIIIEVDAQDNATSKLNGIKSSVHNMEKGLGDLNYSLRQYNNAMSGFNRTMIRGLKEMGSAVYDFTSDAIKNFTEFSEQHAKTLGAMSPDYSSALEDQKKFLQDSQQLQDQAMKLGMYGSNGKGSLRSVSEVAELQTEEIKAGIKAKDVVNTDVTSQILTFAEANDLDTETAVSFATKLSNQFGAKFGTKEFGSMLDKVSHAADTSVIDVKDIIESMKYASGVSSGLGRGIDETLGMVSVMGNFGLTGSQAGSGIQAFLTRLLTQDTTVITEAQKAVAPKNALKAFYDFSKYAKSDGSAISYDDIKSEKYTKKDITGDLRPMDEITDKLDETMGQLNDEEQAWFAKKLFGLYQMKSAYALINGDNANLDDVIEEIKNNSEGTNTQKLELKQDSQWGKFEALSNLWEGVKTQFGSDLSSFTGSILNELNKYLSNNGDYDINWDNIRKGLDESCDLIEEHFGTAIADGVRDLCSFGIDLGQIGEEIGPELGDGISKVLDDLFQGDLIGKDGVTGDWSDMIDNMRTSVEDLPPNLHDLADKIITVIDWMGKLVAIDIATKIGQMLTSALQIGLSVFHIASATIKGLASLVVKPSATTIKSSTAQMTISQANATFGAITTQLMNVNASVVNVNGGIGGTGGGGTGGGGGTPLLTGPTGGSGGTPLLDAPSGGSGAGGAGTALAGGGLIAGLKGKLVQGLVNNGLLQEGASVLGTDGSVISSGLSLTEAGAGAVSGLPIVGLAISELMASKRNEEQRAKNREMAKKAADNPDLEVSYNDANIEWNDSTVGRLANLVGYQKETMSLLNTKEYKENWDAKTDEYKWMNGHENFIGKAEPKKNIGNLWGHTSGYKKDYKEWEDNNKKFANENDEAKKKFEHIQDWQYQSNGSKLKYDDYIKNKKDYDDKYADYLKDLPNISSNIAGMQKLMQSNNEKKLSTKQTAPGMPSNVSQRINANKEKSTTIPGMPSSIYAQLNSNMVNLTGAINSGNNSSTKGLSNHTYGISDIISKIPGLSKAPTSDQQKAIQNTVNNEVTLTPRFTVAAPTVNVDVKVDKDNNVSKNINILNPQINNQLNTWYQKVTSQNGSTTK